VLRYFESREAVLLELLDAAWLDWLTALDETLAGGSGGGDESDGDRTGAGQIDAGDELAATLTASLASRPVLCDLLSAQSAVLERNVSPIVAATYKGATIANVTALAQIVLRRMPELGEFDAMRFAGATAMVTRAIWPSAQPSAAMLLAYESDPALAALRLDFAATLREVLEVLIAGLLARGSRQASPNHVSKVVDVTHVT
jgi:AcrR family transcriptional regulator